ncbi:GHKL domain-containing protein [Holdemania massiliensis]|uniref:GHKL domain-containing protein n=1 Tax=Holdemania massiliensis TaxID=1468449 RepID=A0A6N7S5X3_9FIRM|nr:GHKL domain-containing protein [Holdemania massiliensis]MSA70967.1 GHKL domain-containing protein [Holdemania massiliensis]MSA89293.1 GHKL domain-containing protein [Holdemania massiliensis]MSB78046.1 GHKL domain-containing protein [Holdemania massiliensis]MSC32971.1 GHKL domain-containing protein [Holdemania massiliensis]MSC39368.1 GHKL domain-containing protein [Holdemania massiliensis]
MTQSELLDLGFLLLFTVCEVYAVLYYLSSLRPHSWRRWGLPLLLVTGYYLWNLLSMTSQQTRDIYSILYVLETFLTLMFFVRLYCGCRWRECFYYVIVLFLATRFIRHLIGHLMISAQSTNFLVEGSAWGLRLISCFVLLGIYILILTPVKKMVFRYDLTQQNPVYMGLIALSVVPVVYIGTFAETLGKESWARGLEAISIEGIASICGFLTIVGYQWMMESQRKEEDLQRMQTILKLQYRQVENRQQTMEIVNQKYHDMKNHLQVLEQLEDHEKRRQYLNTLQKQMEGFENFVDTGNETLNVILTDKHECCMRNKIPLLTMIQGELLDFLAPADLTTIFANALDNAIEHVCQLSEDMREINVKVCLHQSWCVIRFDNPCQCDLMLWHKDQLQTTKADAGHGYGLRSIRYTVEKYQGTISTEVINHHFILTLLFPLPEVLLKN